MAASCMVNYSFLKDERETEVSHFLLVTGKTILIDVMTKSYLITVSNQQTTRKYQDNFGQHLLKVKRLLNNIFLSWLLVFYAVYQCSLSGSGTIL